MVTPEFVLTIVGTGVGIIIAMGALILTLFIYSQNRMDTMLKAIQDEIKDFHTHLCIIEERRNKIIFKE